MAFLRRQGLRVVPPTGWEDHDARLTLSTLVAGDLLTSTHPPGSVQACVRPRIRAVRAAAAVVAVAILGAVVPALGAAALVLLGADLARGWWRARQRLPRLLMVTTR